MNTSSHELEGGKWCTWREVKHKRVRGCLDSGLPNDDTVFWRVHLSSQGVWNVEGPWRSRMVYVELIAALEALARGTQPSLTVARMTE